VLDKLVSEAFFSCVLCVASSDYGLFKFMVKCADDTMDSCSFGPGLKEPRGSGARKGGGGDSGNILNCSAVMFS
jgi:hypothetical protein